MKAYVHYNDFTGTIAADRSDLFCERPETINPYFAENFALPVDSDDYHYLGIRVTGTKADQMLVEFFFKKTDGSIVEFLKNNIPFQKVLELFKMFEFVLGNGLENVNQENVRQIEINEE